MRVLVVHNPGTPIRDIRNAIVGAGGDCEAEDCVAPRDLAARLGQVPANLVVVHAPAAGCFCLVSVGVSCIVFYLFFLNDTGTTEIYTRALVGSVGCV